MYAFEYDYRRETNPFCYFISFCFRFKEIEDLPYLSLVCLIYLIFPDLRKIRDYLTSMKMWIVISFLMQKSRTFLLHLSITAIENTNNLFTHKQPGKHLRSKQRCQDLSWKVYDVHSLLFCFHTRCTSYITNTFPIG